jgi:hypothetical protein
MTNAITVTNQEHPDHQLGIDRGPADVAVKCLQLFVQIAQNGRREHVDPSQQVVRRDHLVEAKLVKELPLISLLPPHHRRISCRLLSRNHCSLGFSTPFSTASVKTGKTQHEHMFSAVHPTTDIAKILRHVRFVPIVLQKSFWGDERNFLEPLMRFTHGDVRDHIDSFKIDHGPS